MKLLEYIFSIKNDKKHKVLTVLGVKFKYYSVKNELKEIKKEVKDVKKELKDVKNNNKLLKGYCNHLKYMIDGCCDITACKPAEGNIRQVQLLRLEALKLIVKVFEKNDIQYWLSFGSCIGAYRHKGFIPWDDDIDISVLKKDYRKARDVLNEALKDSDLIAEIGNNNRSLVLRVSDINTGFFYVDIFPFECCSIGALTRESLADKLREIRENFFSTNTKEYLKEDENRIFENHELYKMYKESEININSSLDGFVFRAVESLSSLKRQNVHFASDIFPLQKIQFEDTSFYVPQNTLKYLSECDDGIYGDVMKFPAMSAIYLHKDYSQCGEDWKAEMQQRYDCIQKLMENCN